MDKYFLVFYILGNAAAITPIPEPYYSQDECLAAGKPQGLNFMCVKAPKLEISKSESSIDKFKDCEWGPNLTIKCPSMVTQPNSKPTCRNWSNDELRYIDGPCK